MKMLIQLINNQITIIYNTVNEKIVCLIRCIVKNGINTLTRTLKGMNQAISRKKGKVK